MSGSYPEGAVQIGHPQPWFVGVVVITLACHARDRGFNSRRNRHYGFIAQLAEHKTENLGVVSSILTEATI